MKWMIEINNLDPQQSRILEDVTTNDDKTHWIAGYAGTGKTIVITHAIERIIARSHNASVCFLTYTHALKDLVHSGLSEPARNRVVVETIDTFGSNNEHYDYVLVDEIQDIKEDKIDNIFDRADHVIAAGDPDQSIYLGRVQPSELKKLLGNAKKHTLKNIHRLSLKTFQLASTVLPDAQIVAGANVKDEGSEGKLIRADTF
jgi:superfamily I DNA/RNA helicase